MKPETITKILDLIEEDAKDMENKSAGDIGNMTQHDLDEISGAFSDVRSYVNDIREILLDIERKL